MVKRSFITAKEQLGKSPQKDLKFDGQPIAKAQLITSFLEELYQRTNAHHWNSRTTGMFLRRAILIVAGSLLR